MDEKEIESDLAVFFREACRADVEALKPGNVSIGSPVHNMEYRDFIASADACAKFLSSAQFSLGERILESVKATQRAINNKNTNLGIILLCAPLMHAMYLRSSEESLRNALGRVLAQTTVDDSIKTYQAIRLSQAGNLGKRKTADISEKPTITLQKAMALAPSYDLVARQYLNDYQQIFEYMLPAYLEFIAKWGYSSRYPVVGIYLMFLAEYPDSLVIRKFGKDRANHLRDDVKFLYQEFSNMKNPKKFEDTLLKIDEELKNKRINPGTTADVTVATVLVASLENYINSNLRS